MYMKIFRRWLSSRAKRDSVRPRQARARFAPMLELLEERRLLAAFVVNSLFAAAATSRSSAPTSPAQQASSSAGRTPSACSISRA
jgi:hypothetical protein